MKKEQNILKRYFLWVATTPDPFVTPLILGGIVGFGAGFCALMSAPQLAMVLALGLTGLGAGLGVLSWTVCRLFVSYHPGPELGAFFVYEEYEFVRDGLIPPVPPSNRLWFRKGQKGVRIRWFGLPFTDRRREVKVVLSPFSVLLEIAFNGEFDLGEIFDTIVRRGDYEDLDEWLRSQVLEAAKASDAVQQILRQVSRRHPETLLPELKTSLWVALKGAGFPKVLGNIEGIEFTLRYTRTSIATFDLD